MGIEKIQNELRAAAKKEKIKIYQNFHKTSNDGYAQGEIFLGVTVPDIRKVALSNFNISIAGKLTGWDLVDTTASQVVGRYIYTYSNDYSILNKLAHGNLWERRVAIIVTLYLIKNKKYEQTLKISEILLFDNHDLIHKAVGWMLREVGKNDE